MNTRETTDIRALRDIRGIRDVGDIRILWISKLLEK